MKQTAAAWNLASQRTFNHLIIKQNVHKTHEFDFNTFKRAIIFPVYYLNLHFLSNGFSKSKQLQFLETTARKRRLGLKTLNQIKSNLFHSNTDDKNDVVDGKLFNDLLLF